MIPTPFHSAGDRDLDCEDALEGAVDALVEQAVTAGWTHDEIANALLSLAQTRIEARRAEAVIGIEPVPSGLRH